MSKQSLALRLLVTLYRAASRGRLLTESSLAELAELESNCMRELLVELDRAGYVDREQLRLTMLGLTLAAAAGKRPNRKPIARAA